MKELIGKIFCSFIIAIICFIPVWFFLGGRSFLSPEGFFQEFFIFGIGLYFLGFAQLCLLGVFIFLMVSIWA
jgi:hypothetical protein